jgi:hypothetical protein
VDWIYDQLGDDDESFKNEDILKEKIKELDKKKVLDPWLSGNWTNDVNEGKESSGDSLQDKINEVNQEYVDEITAEINSANTEAELDAIDIDTEYADSDELGPLLDAKREELAVPLEVEVDGETIPIPESFQRGRPRDEITAVTQQLAGEFIENVDSALSNNDLGALRELEIPAGPKSLKTFLKDRLDDAISTAEANQPEEEGS